MNRTLRARVAQLEEILRIDPVVLYFADAEPPLAISSSAKNFFRLMVAMQEPQAPGDALLQLDSLRRAVRIEGRDAQLFYLAQSLALGPADDHNHE